MRKARVALTDVQEHVPGRSALHYMFGEEGAQMAEAKDCPKCGLVNPPSAQRCDCGWDFVSNRQERSYLQPQKRMSVMAGIGGGFIAVIIVVRVCLWLLLTAPN